MPFTLAHPAAVLPLTRGRAPLLGLPASALVAGALAPDVFFYAPRALYPVLPSGELTHSLTGMVTIDLVTGLLLVALWRLLLRPPVLDVLAEPWRGAATSQTSRPVVTRRPLAAAARSAALAVAAVLLGTLTHLALDLLTHEPRPGAAVAVPVDELTLLGRPVPLVGQYALSVLGLAVLAWAAWRWVGRVAGPRRRRPLRRGAVVVLALAAPLVLIGGVARIEAGHDSATAVIADMLFGAVATAFALLLAYAVAWWTVRRRGRQVLEATVSAGGGGRP